MSTSSPRAEAAVDKGSASANANADTPATATAAGTKSTTTTAAPTHAASNINTPFSPSLSQPPQEQAQPSSSTTQQRPLATTQSQQQQPSPAHVLPHSSSTAAAAAKAATSTQSSSNVVKPQPPSPFIPAASGYGTRSRNRAAPRPNYAEDPDIDVDLELLSPTRHGSTGLITANVPAGAGAAVPSAEASSSSSGSGSASSRPTTSRKAGHSTTTTTIATNANANVKAEKQGGSARHASSSSRARRSHAAGGTASPSTGSARKDKDARSSNSNNVSSRTKDKDASGNANASSTSTITVLNTSSTNLASNTTSANQSQSTAGRKRKQPGAGSGGKDGNAGGASSGTAVSNAKRVWIAPANIPDRKVGAGAGAAYTRNMMTFTKDGAYLKNGKLKADDGTVLAPNDHVYLICEPPGEPYYIARIMEFLPAKDKPDGPIETVRVDWYYRGRDISGKTGDPRMVYASMQCDTCPLTSLRGKCTIKHRDEIDDLDAYRRQRDNFYFDKFYDRYMIRYYEVVPSKKVINVPAHIKKVLDQRWKYVIVEIGRPKEELCKAGKTCKKCGKFAATSASVDCAECKATYHMNCVDPPLLRKPQRGFAWSCAACSRARERKLEARNTPSMGVMLNRRDGIELFTEDKEDKDEMEVDQPAASQDSAGSADGDKEAGADSTTQAAEVPIEAPLKLTPEQQRQSQLWPFRYFGMHSKAEDILDLDDRINPRAKSRIGGRHQATVPPWYGHSVAYVKKKKGGRRELAARDSGSNANSDSEWTGKAGAPRPKWVMEEPPGYIPRGEDGPVMVNGREVKTAELLWSMPKDDEIPESFERGMSPEEEAKEEEPVKEEGKERNADDDKKEEGDGEKELKGDKPHKETRVDKYVDEYMAKVRELAPTKSIQPYSTNYLDRALKLLKEENYDQEKALARLRTVNRYADLKEPHLRNDQIKAFEAGVAKYGSELRLVTKHVGTVPHKHIVRFYYMWKKTPRGKQIWGNFEGRRSGQARKQQLENGTSNAAAMSHGAGSPARLVDDIADDEDDSAFDTDKAEACRKGFTCKFCNTKKSREWRRAPWTPPGAFIQPAGGDKKDQAGAGGAQTNGTTVNSNGKRPNSTKAKDDRPLAIALCHRCAIMWRKYGVQWEEPDEVMRRIIAGGSKSWRRRSEEDHLAQLLLSSETDVKINNSTANAAQALGINVVPVAPEDVEAVEKKLAGEPSKKKTKTEKETGQAAGAAVDGHVTAKKQKRDKQHSVAPAPPVPEPPLEPEPPRARTLPCAVCNKVEPRGDQYLSCKDCRMSVHKACYGQLAGHPADVPVTDPEHAPSLTSTSSKWLCDMCFNDRDPHASLAYECCLCPITYTEQELMDPPRFSHKKKTDREREKERLEKEMVAEAIRLYRERQMEAGKPINPREPLKRTEGNNWVHVHCAVFTPEIKFGDAKRLEPAEGLGLVSRERRVDMCKLCRRHDPCGATISCRNSSCNAKFHAGCARDAGYVLGFELVSSSKQLGRGSHGHARSSSNVETPGPAVKVGEETGVLVPGIWCSHHTLPANFHEMGELLKRPGKEGETASATPTPESAGSASSSEPINILQLYVQTYKQADLALTGTARKAANLQQSVGAANQAQVQGRPGRRGSIAVNGDGMQLRGERGVTAPTEGPAAKDYGSAEPSSPIVAREGKKKCTWCLTTASPRFYPFQAYMIANAPSAQTQQYPAASPGPPPVNGVMAMMHQLHAKKHASGLRVNDNKEGVVVNSQMQPPAPTILSAEQAMSLPPSAVVPTTLYKCHKCHMNEKLAQEAQRAAPSVSAPPPQAYPAPPASAPPAQPHSLPMPHLPVSQPFATSAAAAMPPVTSASAPITPTMKPGITLPPLHPAPPLAPQPIMPPTTLHPLPHPTLSSAQQPLQPPTNLRTSMLMGHPPHLPQPTPSQTLPPPHPSADARPMSAVTRDGPGYPSRPSSVAPPPSLSRSPSLHSVHQQHQGVPHAAPGPAGPMPPRRVSSTASQLPQPTPLGPLPTTLPPQLPQPQPTPQHRSPYPPVAHPMPVFLPPPLPIPNPASHAQPPHAHHAHAPIASNMVQHPSAHLHHTHPPQPPPHTLPSTLAPLQPSFAPISHSPAATEPHPLPGLAAHAHMHAHAQGPLPPPTQHHQQPQPPQPRPLEHMGPLAPASTAGTTGAPTPVSASATPATVGPSPGNATTAPTTAGPSPAVAGPGEQRDATSTSMSAEQAAARTTPAVKNLLI